MPRATPVWPGAENVVHSSQGPDDPACGQERDDDRPSVGHL